MRADVNVRWPLVYLGVAAVVALAGLVLPDRGSGEVSAGPPAPAPPAASAAPLCTEIRDSLRPGPLYQPGAMPSGSTMAAIAARGRLIAGVDQGKYLVGYRDPRTGELQGSDIDIVRLLAAAILGNPDRVQYVVLNISDREQALVDRRVDVVVNTFTITCTRQRQIEFSAPYLPFTQRILVPKASGITNLDQLAGKRVCTSKGSITVAKLSEPARRLHVQTYPFIPDCMVDLQRGRVDAVSSDELILAGLAAQDPQTKVVGPAIDSGSYGIGINHDQPDLVQFVNAVLDRARTDGTLQGIVDKWLAPVLHRVPQPLPYVDYRD